MSTKTRVPIESKALLKQFWISYGAIAVVEAIKQAGSTLPGAALAAAMAEKTLADFRVHLSLAVYKEAAKAGFDINKVLSVVTTWEKDNPVLEVEMPDLADEGAAP